MSSTKNCVQVYARVRPLKKPEHDAVMYSIESYHQKNGSGEDVVLQTRRKSDPNYRRLYKFRFQRVFDIDVSQEKVFEGVTKPVVERVLDGYNGTVFAYGQTGSGKTYTITGSTEVYDDRGIIPRTIQYLFGSIRSNPEVMYSVYVSYLEIYNEAGYDLLDQKSSAVKLDDLQKVSMLEDALGNTHLRNLSVIPVTTETDALKLLFFGDSNRTIAETAMNPFSSRSHCIFTIHVGIRKPNSKTIRRGKLHLVDLAGSERLTKLSGTQPRITMNETRNINLTLHHLEQVILALSERKRQHVPYRNSMLTSVLRDSLGGNCLTVMIATLSIRQENFAETLSTCRFAQRVALVHNQVAVNEESDPLEEVFRLKQEVVNLRAELAFSQTSISSELTDHQKENCHEAVSKFLSGATERVQIDPDINQFHFCFTILRDLFSKSQSKESTPKSDQSISEPCPKIDTLKNYQELIKQRDNEICILMNLLRNEKDSKRSEASETLSVSSKKSSSREAAETTDEWLTTLSSVSSPRSSIFNEQDEDDQVGELLHTLEQKMALAHSITIEIKSIRNKLITMKKSGKDFHKYENLCKEKVRTLRELKSETDHIKRELNLIYRSTSRENVDHSKEEKELNFTQREPTQMSNGVSIEKQFDSNSACSIITNENYVQNGVHLHESSKISKTLLKKQIGNVDDISSISELQHLNYPQNFEKSRLNLQDQKVHNSGVMMKDSNSRNSVNTQDKTQKQYTDQLLQFPPPQLDEDAMKDLNEEIVQDGFEVLYENKTDKSDSESNLLENEVNKTEEGSKIVEFNEFMKKIPMTGDDEVDQEIVNFYKEQFGLV